MFSEHILSAKKRGNRHFVYGLYVDSLYAYVRRRIYGSEIYKMGAAFQGYSGKFIRALSSLSLGIYVTHMLVLFAFDKVAVFAEHPVYYSVFMPFIAYIICAVLSFVIKKIPILKHIMP